MMLPPRKRTSPASPGAASVPPSPAMRTSNPGRGRPTVVATASGSSSSEVPHAVPLRSIRTRSDHLGAREFGVDPPDQLDRHVRGAGHGDPQGREVVPVPADGWSRMDW